MQLIQMDEARFAGLSERDALLLLRQTVLSQSRLISSLFRRVDQWERTLETRETLIAKAAAEEAAAQVSAKVLAELGRLAKRVEETEEDVDEATTDARVAMRLAERGSSPTIVVETGRHKAVQESSVPPSDKVVSRWRRRLTILGIVLAGVAAAVGTAVQAYRAAVTAPSELPAAP